MYSHNPQTAGSAGQGVEEKADEGPVQAVGPGARAEPGQMDLGGMNGRCRSREDLFAFLESLRCKMKRVWVGSNE